MFLVLLVLLVLLDLRVPAFLIAVLTMTFLQWVL
jgi:hypothetical protein